MTRGRTVTLTEYEVDTLRAAIILWEAEYEVADDYPGSQADRAREYAALERVSAKLAAQSPARRRSRRSS